MYPAALRRDAVERYKRGHSARSIGFALSIGEGTVLQLLKEEGVTVRSRTRTWRTLNNQDAALKQAQKRARA